MRAGGFAVMRASTALKTLLANARRSPGDATRSHDHVEVVAAFEGRIGQRHAAQSAHGVRIGSAATSGLSDHRRIAGLAPADFLPVIVVLANESRTHTSLGSQ
jgi:hypothetical protein